MKPLPRIDRGQGPLLQSAEVYLFDISNVSKEKQMSFFTFNTKIVPPKCDCQSDPFNIRSPGINLYDSTARQLAEDLAKPELLVEKKRGKERWWEVISDKDANKPTQIRKIYDELCMWEQKTRDVETFAKLLPFIKMMNAKVAYARGRELVDEKFVAWFSTCMDQIREPNEAGLSSFKNFRTHFEAFLGFFKRARPS